MNDSLSSWVYLAGLVLGSVIRAIHTGRARSSGSGSGFADSRGGGSRSGPGNLLDSGLLGLTGLAMFVLPLISIFTPWIAPADYRIPVAGVALGSILFAGALVLLHLSHADLGRNWSPRPGTGEGQTLVTSGIYRRIRHPMYAAHWLWAGAQALLVPNGLAGPAMLVTFLPTYLHRVRLEERAMLDRFGEEYAAYMKRTGRLLPRKTD